MTRRHARRPGSSHGTSTLLSATVWRRWPRRFAPQRAASSRTSRMPWLSVDGEEAIGLCRRHYATGRRFVDAVSPTEPRRPGAGLAPAEAGASDPRHSTLVGHSGPGAERDRLMRLVGGSDTSPVWSWLPKTLCRQAISSAACSYSSPPNDNELFCGADGHHPAITACGSECADGQVTRVAPASADDPKRPWLALLASSRHHLGGAGRGDRELASHQVAWEAYSAGARAIRCRNRSRLARRFAISPL